MLALNSAEIRPMTDLEIQSVSGAGVNAETFIVSSGTSIASAYGTSAVTGTTLTGAVTTAELLVGRWLEQHSLEGIHLGGLYMTRGEVV